MRVVNIIQPVVHRTNVARSARRIWLHLFEINGVIIDVNNTP